MANLVVKDEKVLPQYQEVLDNFRIAAAFSKEAFYSALKYKPRSDDLFIVTYPKCGLIWVQQIVACIYRNGHPFDTALEFMSNSPYLEFTGAEAAETMERPGAIKLHLPFRLTPYSPEAKYIFVARNPKDCCVSFYHHVKNMAFYRFAEGVFDDFFELFMDGKASSGDYFDTLLSWYEHRNDPNVLFITYEELKEDTKGNILKIAEFLGKQYKEALESDPKLLKDVVHYSSFDYMKESLNKQFEEMGRMSSASVLNNPNLSPRLKALFKNSKEGEVLVKTSNHVQFIRKGIVGDWRNYLSEEQNRRMEAKFRERMKGTDISKLWEEEMNTCLEIIR